MFEHRDGASKIRMVAESEWVATAAFSVGVASFVVVWWWLGQ